jgi:hypothetical protein
VEDVRRTDHIPLLRKRDDIGAGRSGARDEFLGLFEVRRLLPTARQLGARDANPVGHGAEDTREI